MTMAFKGKGIGAVALLTTAGLLGVAVMTASGPAVAAAPAGDATKGKVVFAKCAICHAVEPGKTSSGRAWRGSSAVHRQRCPASPIPQR